MILRPLQPRDLPNLITGLRIVLVGPFLWLLLEQRYPLALLLFVLAGVSDALDGFLAKRYGWTSELGGLLDPVADKILLIGAILALAWLRELPVWLAVLVVARDAIIVGGAVLYHLRIERFQAAPLPISKFNTLLQVLLVGLVILHYGLLPLPTGLLTALVYATALTTVWSGATYVWHWGQRARHKARASEPPATP